MSGRRVLQSVLHNFLGTYTSRYTEYEGYWLFGFVIDGLERMTIDLLNPQCMRTVNTPIEVAVRLAAGKFTDQMSKARLPMACVQEAGLVMEKTAGSRPGVVNGHACLGYDTRFVATAVSDRGRPCKSEVSLFIAPHDPQLERRSMRAC